MDVYPIKELAKEVAALPVADVQDVIAFVPLAARLAALGDRSELKRWRELAKPLGESFVEALVARCHEGIWDLQHAVGEDLALSVISAQDFACFLQLEGNLLPPAAAEWIAAWRDEADETPLNDDAAATLELFLHRFPLAEDVRLAVVDSPISTFVEAVLGNKLEFADEGGHGVAGYIGPQAQADDELAHAADVEEATEDEIAIVADDGSLEAA